MRFHLGISFSFKKIKKYIIPFLLGLSFYFINTYFVNAEVINDNVLNIDYENVDFSKYQKIDNKSPNEYFNELIDWYNSNDTKYDLTIFISKSGYSQVIISEKKELLYVQPFIVKETYNSYFEFSYKGLTSSTVYTFSGNYNSSKLEIVKKALLGNVTLKESDGTTSSSKISSFDYTNYSISDGGYIPYFSSTDLVFDRFDYPGNNTYSYYPVFKFILKNKSYLVGNSFPTYFNWSLGIYDLDFNFNKKETYDNYNGFFISQIPVNRLNNLNVTIAFSSKDKDFIDNISYPVSNYYGRYKKGDYYVYDTLTCESQLSLEPVEEVNGLYRTKHYYYGVTCSEDLSKYDYIYISKFSNGRVPISNLEFKTNFGEFILNDVSTNHDIVDSFQVERNQNLFVSSSLQEAYVYNLNNDNIFVLGYELDTKNNLKFNFIKDFNKFYSWNRNDISIGSSKNRGLNFRNTSDNTEEVKLLFDPKNTLISISSSNNVSYVDGENVIHNEEFNFIDYKDDVVSNYFDNFNDEDFGGLSSVVKAPLMLIKNFTSGTCKAIEIPVLGSSITLQCGDELFWNREDVSEFKKWWNLFWGGLICYGIARNFYSMIRDFKDPESDKVEVMDL